MVLIKNCPFLKKLYLKENKMDQKAMILMFENLLFLEDLSIINLGLMNKNFDFSFFLTLSPNLQYN